MLKISLVVQCIGIQFAYDKLSYAMHWKSINLVVQCILNALLTISIVVQCIGIALLMKSIVVECNRIK